MYVVVNVRYQPELVDWAYCLRHSKQVKIDDRTEEVLLETEIARALTFFSRTKCEAGKVRLEFDQGDMRDRPFAELRIEVRASGCLPENQVLAALSKIKTALRNRLPLAHLCVALQVGELGFAEESLPD